ncbi:unnamed protein product [Parascedosporium putredinis]|uniref:DUF676 domain-containing protein n=1 Tax=Parascedosporium putredinis TaxID=1442378 RepID=A0A9P1H1I2_9PEZI|nr:unnamed protein product [Parascedosporium putredinis]CAI7993090.1 unnamed protein product [Parascedosporium putredinis]
MGLALLYTPLEADPPRPHAVDLVLIHGLNGDATRSWTNAATAAFWPGEFLPVDVPEARIFNFGYNADAVFGNTTADIVDHAKDLLSSLIDEREGERKSQPIIFIAHSLGGIIVKQALLSAKTELRYQSIQQNTLGIIFFGTPHRGSDKANSKLVKALKENSDTLAQLTTAFRRELSQYQIVSFYEMKPPGFLRTLIVSKESALLNIDEEDQVPIDRSHRDLCKFAKRNDATYGKLVKEYAGFSTKSLRVHDKGTAVSNLSFYIPFPSNPHFVGREDLLEKLQEKLFSSNSVHNVAIFGLGGIGKTQLALRLIYWVKENRPNHSIFWVSALSYATFEQAYAEIFKKVGLQQFDKEDPKETLCDYLSSEKAGQWLLVIDNADDEDLLLLSTKQQRSISDYLPSSDNGRILYTTRTKRIATSVAGGNSMKLPEMTENEAKGFSPAWYTTRIN